MEVIAAPRAGRNVAVLSGSFHPVTRAHLALGEAALRVADTVLFTMPRRFPHKSYDGVTLAERIELVRIAAAAEPRFGVAITDGGLFREIAAELRAENQNVDRLWFVCGRDAAERIVAWDYGDGPSIGEQLREFGLLVADRQGSYLPPPDLAASIRRLPMPAHLQDVSATEIRRRIEAGGNWRELVPPAIEDAVRTLYGPRR
ncbi:MAG: hypothetical protein R2762_01950 [Bryobacteraceae bacterium]